MLEPLTEFQHRFYAKQPQLHPSLDCFAKYILRLYEHYETCAANAMITSTCAFVNACVLEVRALTKRVPLKKTAKLWPYYIRNMSGEWVHAAC